MRNNRFLCDIIRINKILPINYSKGYFLRMKKILIVTFLFFLVTCVSKNTNAQFYFYDKNYYDNPVVYELGGSIGMMNCLTDLGGSKGVGKKFIKDINLGNTQFAGSVYFSAIFKSAIAIRVEGTFGQVKAYDSILKNVKATTFGRYERNLSFRSNITEIMTAIEIHPLLFKRNSEVVDLPKISPYLMAGIGYFSFNPQAKLLNKWVDLQPLSTEGQGFAEYPNKKPYSLHQICIPIGTGIRYELSSSLNLRAEFVYRILSTDYLDDVSNSYADPNLYANYFTGTKLNNALLLADRQYELDPTHITVGNGERGNSKNNDAYFTFNLKIGLILGREKIRP